jgi:glycosyltransferase involved in cell wall biosynthesis
VHRLVTYKRPLLVAEAFRDLPFRLTMVGVGPLEKSLKSMGPPNVEVRGWVSESELVSLFERATGFVHVGEEDFGMSMVEALAAGAPVIALRKGGAFDIVRDQTDGILIDEPSVESLRRAVVHVASRGWDTADLATQAGRFSTERFKARFVEHLEQVLSTSSCKAGGALGEALSDSP